MVIKPLKFLVLPLLLASCGFFRLTHFPEDLPLVVAEVDLEDRLGSYLEGFSRDDTDYWFSDIQDNTDQNYLILVLRKHGDQKTRILFFDSDLLVLADESDTQGGRISAYNQNSSYTPSGRSFIVGIEVFDGESLEYMGNFHELGFPHPPDRNHLIFSTGANNYEIFSDAGVFQIIETDNAWNELGFYTTNPVDRYLVKLTHDILNREVILFQQRYGSAQVIRLKQTDFPDIDDGGSIEHPFRSTFESGELELERDPWECQYTRSGIIVVGQQDSSAEFFDHSGRWQGAAELENGDESVFVFDIQGHHYYRFDFRELKLKKYRTRWHQ